MSFIRLNKFIAACGISSRRKAEELIKNGRVSINGKQIRELGTFVTENDIVEIDGQRIKKETDKIYIILNKPSGYVCTVKDQFGRKTVLDLIKNLNVRLFPVGRLDYNTSGLLFLTNDGEFSLKLTHPKFQKDKKYIALLKGVPDNEDIKSFQAGINIDGYVTKPAKITIIEQKKYFSKVEITISEGRNRQIRKMCEAIGHPVIKLMRTSIAGIDLGNLRPGEWRYLTKEEIIKLIS